MNTTEIERIVMRLGEKRKRLEYLHFSQTAERVLGTSQERSMQEIAKAEEGIQEEEHKLEAAILAVTKEIQNEHGED